MSAQKNHPVVAISNASPAAAEFAPPGVTVLQHVMSDGFGDAASAILCCYAMRTINQTATVFLGAWFDNLDTKAVVQDRLRRLCDIANSMPFLRLVCNGPGQSREEFIEMMRAPWQKAKARIISCVPKIDTWLDDAVQTAYPECTYVAYTEYSTYQPAAYCASNATTPNRILCVTAGLENGGVLRPLPRMWDKATPMTKVKWLQWLNAAKDVDVHRYKIWVYYQSGTRLDRFITERVLPTLNKNPKNKFVGLVVVPAINPNTVLPAYPNVRYVNISIPFSRMRSLMQVAEPWVGVTGDQSFVEAMVEAKYIDYEERKHKQGMYAAYLRQVLITANLGATLITEPISVMPQPDLFELYRKHVTPKTLDDFSKKVTSSLNLFGPGRALTNYINDALPPVTLPPQTIILQTPDAKRARPS